jgi:ABC-2 type transport system ATP-binding protein
MAPLIRAEGLTKQFHRVRARPGRAGSLLNLVHPRYEAVPAVRGVDFIVEGGELVGYLGPNGAGKSTTIKMMTGILTPTSGLLEVGGLVPWRDRERNALQIGVVFGQRTQLWWDLPLRESFELLRAMYRMTPTAYRRSLDALVDALSLAPFLDQQVRQLSLGQRMRGDLAAAMLHSPRVLYLDEPTIGLDIVVKESARAFIEQMNRESGTTVVMTTHDLADVERLCRRIVLIDHGTVLFDGPVEQLKAKYARQRNLVVRLNQGPGGFPHITPDDVAGAQIAEQRDGMVRISFESEKCPVQELIARVNARYPVADLSIVEPDLEGVVRRIYAEGRLAA